MTALHRAIFLMVLVALPLLGVIPRPAQANPPKEALMQFAHDYWEHVLKTNPLSATQLGDHRYDDRLSDITPEGIATEARWLRDFEKRVAAVDAATLGTEDKITRNALLFEIQSAMAGLTCGFEEWVVDPLGGPQVEFFNIPAYQAITDPASGKAMVERWRAMPAYFDQHVANLKRGLAAGKVSIRAQVERTIAEIDELEKMPLDEWALVKPGMNAPSSWSSAERTAFSKDMKSAVADGVRPALLRYRDFLRAEVLPKTRGNDKPGIMHVPGGAECYQSQILRHTSLALRAEEIHRIGLDEVSRINDELRLLGKTVLGTDDLEKIHSRLRTDPAMHFKTRDEVAAKAEEALRRSEAAMPKWFGILPKASCNVVRMEAHEEKHSTIAYYRQPAVDGSRPGSYYINTYAPETRPRYEAEALAFHEAVPGHHLQIAIAQELKDLPEFRKHSGVTAFVEGWGLYSERLANEMGLYSGDVDRIGMLSYDSWRACRLVVDTGMHAMGWTRQQAIDYMIANSVLAENNITNEVDRYITWPGQALAYKLGQREIFRLRDKAKQAMGPAFDIKQFHDVVLRDGAVDLGTLGKLVDDWIQTSVAGKQSGGR
ncbi:MAG TPA: DUF885 domain-containing protein [Candidatus Eisenbacteria bacterium]|nr:DUF885 domain-containing protein [Candidatus Eisenbacteria bacterium]